jgi:hypothetical protein
MYKHIHYNILSQRKIYMISFCGLTTFARMRSDPQKSPVFAFFFLCLIFVIRHGKARSRAQKCHFRGILRSVCWEQYFCLYCSLAYARSHKHVSYIYIIYRDNAYACFILLARLRSLASIYNRAIKRMIFLRGAR